MQFTGMQLGSLPAAQRDAIRAEVLAWAKCAGTAERLHIMDSADYGEGIVSITVSSDAGFMSTSLKADGSFFDSDPVKPWELAD